MYSIDGFDQIMFQAGATHANVSVVSHAVAHRPSPSAGSGSGLLGLAERLALVGGHLDHHTDGRGDFVLRAGLPVSQPVPAAAPRR